MSWLWIGTVLLALVIAALGRVAWSSTRIPEEIPASDRPLFVAALAAVRDEFGPAALSSAIPPGMHRHDAYVYAAFFVMFRDLYLADGPALTRAEREILATSVSRSNTCHYCTQVHGTLVRAGTRSLSEQILRGQIDQIEDPRQRTLALYGSESKHATAPIITDPPLTAEEASDAAITVVSFHYVNRILDALGPEGFKLKILSSPPQRLLATAMKLDQPLSGGVALRKLRASDQVPPIGIDEADRAHITRWTLGRPEATDAMIFTWSMIQHAARQLFSAEVLDTIRAHLAGWRGEDTGLDDPWLERAVAGLAHHPADQELARQALIVARETFRIDREALLQAVGGDLRRQLVLVSFAACATALRIGEWLVIPGADGARDTPQEQDGATHDRRSDAPTGRRSPRTT